MAQQYYLGHLIEPDRLTPGFDLQRMWYDASVCRDTGDYARACGQLEHAETAYAKVITLETYVTLVLRLYPPPFNQ